MIPANRLDPVAVKLMDFYPVPNRPPSNRGGRQQLRREFGRKFRWDNVTAKIDRAWSDRNRMYFRFNY